MGNDQMDSIAMYGEIGNSSIIPIILCTSVSGL
jgi:hypothetical protein